MIISLEEKTDLTKWFEEIVLYAKEHINRHYSKVGKWEKKDQEAYEEIKNRIKKGGK